MNQKTLILTLLVAVIILSGTTIYYATKGTNQQTTPISNIEQQVAKNEFSTKQNVDKVQPKVTEQPKKELPVTPKSSASLAIYKNSTYGFEISLPASWSAYSGYDGKVIATEPSMFPSDPGILTGTPPTLDFQIDVIENNTITSYTNSFLKDAVRSGSKYLIGNEVFYLVQSGKNVIKLYSSDSGYDLNDEIFNSLKLTK